MFVAGFAEPILAYIFSEFEFDINWNLNLIYVCLEIWNDDIGKETRKKTFSKKSNSNLAYKIRLNCTIVSLRYEKSAIFSIRIHSISFRFGFACTIFVPIVRIVRHASLKYVLWVVFFFTQFIYNGYRVGISRAAERMRHKLCG